MSRPKPVAPHSTHELRYLLERVDKTRLRAYQRKVAVVRTAPVLAILLVLGGAWYWQSTRNATQQLARAPLYHLGGELVAVTSELATGEGIPLSDGSHLRATGGSKLVVLENTADEFRTALHQGKVAYNVRPARRKRRWAIEIEDVLVEVVGTRFVVDRRNEHVRVDVERGLVRVTGPTVEGGTRTLAAGESLEVLVKNPERTLPTPEESDSAQMMEPSADIDGAGSVEPSAEVDGVGTGSSSASSDAPVLEEPEVLRRADALRGRGNHREAANLLKQAIGRQGRTGESAILLLTLGRIQLHSLGQPHAAAVSFNRAIHRGLPPGLREQAMARSVHAWASANNHENAMEMATRYLREYPEGPNREYVLRWIERP